MTRGFLLSVLLVIPNMTLAVAESALTPAVVSKEIHTLGAKRVLSATFHNEPKWSELRAGIATGSKEWLSIAIKLYPYSDAGPAEALNNSLGEALDHHPENILSLAVPVFDVSLICSGPDVDDPRFDSYELSMAEIAKRRKTVRSISDPKLAKLRDACMLELENSKKGIAGFYQHKPD